MKRLFLHIGTHKTGSTAIQYWLAGQRDALRRQGIHYGSTDRPPHPNLPKHNSLFWSLANPKGDFAAEKAAILADFEDSGCHTLILSEEGLSEPIHRKLDRISELREHFEIEVVCFLRRQDYFLESLWNQKCREGLEKRSINAFVAADHNRRRIDYIGKIDFWSKIGKVRLAIYDENSPSSVEAFANIVGIEHDGIQQVANPSPSMNCAVSCNLVNRWRSNPTPATLISMFEGDIRQHALGRRLRKTILEDCAASNKLLSERYGITFDRSVPQEPERHIRWPSFFSVLSALLSIWRPRRS